MHSSESMIVGFFKYIVDIHKKLKCCVVIFSGAGSTPVLCLPTLPQVWTLASPHRECPHQVCHLQGCRYPQVIHYPPPPPPRMVPLGISVTIPPPPPRMAPVRMSVPLGKSASPCLEWPHKACPQWESDSPK
jgi:hypothetical protein